MHQTNITWLKNVSSDRNEKTHNYYVLVKSKPNDINRYQQYIIISNGVNPRKTAQPTSI